MVEVICIVRKRVSVVTKKVTSATFEGFMQYFVGAIVLGIGVLLIAVDINTLIRKLGLYRHIIDIRIDTTYFTVPAVLCSMPCFFLTTRLSFNRRRLFFALLGIQVIAILTLTAGYAVGTKYSPKFSNKTLQLDSTIPKEYLNNTLYTYIANYGENTEYTNSLNKIQKSLKCCGVYSTGDFIKIPDSCCPWGDCEKSSPYDAGCLRCIQEDVAWHKNVTLSVVQLGLLLFLFDGLMMVAVYISYFNRWKEWSLLNAETKN